MKQKEPTITLKITRNELVYIDARLNGLQDDLNPAFLLTYGRTAQKKVRKLLKDLAQKELGVQIND